MCPLGAIKAVIAPGGISPAAGRSTDAAQTVSGGRGAIRMPWLQTDHPHRQTSAMAARSCAALPQSRSSRGDLGHNSKDNPRAVSKERRGLGIIAAGTHPHDASCPRQPRHIPETEEGRWVIPSRDGGRRRPGVDTPPRALSHTAR